MLNRRTAPWLLLLLPLLAWSPLARAQQVSTLLNPAASPHGIVTVQTTRALGHLWFYGAITSHYANDELVARSDDELVSRPLQHRAVSELALGFGLFNRLDVTLSLPLVIFQSSQNYPAEGQPETRRGVGDLRLGLKGRIFTWEGLGLAAMVEATAPTASDEPLMGEQSWTITPRLVLDYRFPCGAVVAFNVGYKVRQEVAITSLAVDDELRLGLGAELPLNVAGLWLLAEVYAGIGLGSRNPDPLFPAESKIPMEALGGVRWRHDSGVMLTAGMGAGLTAGYGAPDFRALLALGYSNGFGGTRPAAAPRKVSQPAPTPASRPATTAAPPPPPVRPLKVAAFDGAVSGDPDPDGDGIPSANDRCPQKPEDPDDFEDSDGCPDLDNDADGIPDAQDRCPLKKEVVNGVQDDDGCPDQGLARVAIRAGKVEITRKVFFDSGSDRLKAVSHDILNQVAGVLRANWQLRLVRVEGHTDHRGDKEMNVDLSERRAMRVKAYLVQRGVASFRLQTKGYGPTRPVSRRRSREAMAKNRRVEFTIIKVARTRAAGGAP